jgi:hypothetical protein
MGSACAPRAVFRALAENIGRSEVVQGRRTPADGKMLAAGRVQLHSRRVCSPTPEFEPDRLAARPADVPYLG